VKVSPIHLWTRKYWLNVGSHPPVHNENPKIKKSSKPGRAAMSKFSCFTLVLIVYVTACYSSGAWLTWTGQFFGGERTSLHQLQTPAPCTSWSYPEHTYIYTMQHSNLNIENNGASNKQKKCETRACVTYIVYCFLISNLSLATLSLFSHTACRIIVTR